MHAQTLSKMLLCEQTDQRLKHEIYFHEYDSNQNDERHPKCTAFKY